MGDETTEFIHRVGVTAFYISHIRADEELQPDSLFTDPYAHHFYHQGTADMFRTMPYHAREYFFSLLRVRIRWIDDVVQREIDQGTRQVISLGAGFDCRGIRFARPDVKFVDVDRAEVLAFKARHLAAAHVEHDVIGLAADYTLPGFREGLLATGLDPSKRTLLVWEGNTLYLPPELIAQTLKILSTEFLDPVIVFDFLGGQAIRGSASPKMAANVANFEKAGHPIMGWIDDLSGLAAEVGLWVFEEHSLPEMMARYLPKRDLGADVNSEYFYAVLARPPFTAETSTAP